jgi:hypothetical protein
MIQATENVIPVLKKMEDEVFFNDDSPKVR